MLEQYPNFVPYDEVHEDTSLSEEGLGVRSTKMKDVRNVIATSLWRDRH